MYCLDFVDITLGERIPYRAAILKMWANKALVCLKFNQGWHDLNRFDLNRDLNHDLNHPDFFLKITDLNHFHRLVCYKK